MTPAMWILLAVLVLVVLAAWIHELHCRIEKLEGGFVGGTNPPMDLRHGGPIVPPKPRPAHWTDPA